MQAQNQPATGKRFRLLYETSGLSQVRMLNILAISFFIAGLGMAFMMLKAPPPVLSSQTTRIGWIAFILLFAGTCPVWAWSYGRRVASRVMVSLDGRTLRVYQPNLMGVTARDIAVEDVVLTKEADGDPAGEEQLTPRRLEVAVRNQPGFVVSFGRGSQKQKESLLRTLRT